MVEPKHIGLMKLDNLLTFDNYKVENICYIFQSFGWNLMGAVAIFSWSAAVSTLLFGSMRLLGVLRVSAEVEIAGLDKLKHGEPAYPVKGYSSCEHPVTKLNHSCKYFVIF